MADNTQLNIAVTSGDVIATEDIGGTKHELIKVEFGADGVATKVSAADPLPVTLNTSTLATSAKQDTGNSSLASIDGKLTNPLPISGVVTTGGLTDTQLRASAVPVSGTVTANTGLTQPLTDTQLRATPVPVSGTVSVDTTGLATSAKQDTGNASLASIDGKLTNPLPVSGTITATATDLDIRNLVFATDKVDASGTVLGAGNNNIGDVDVASVAGNVTVVQPTGTNLHTVIDSGTITTVSTVTAVTAISNALPAGSNVIGHVITDTGSTTAVTGTVTTAPTVPTTIINGKTTVATAGSRTTLAASTTVKSVTIKALSTNTGFIYVGDTSVASTNGFQLSARESVSMDLANLNTINIDSSVNGEGVTYLAVN